MQNLTTYGRAQLPWLSIALRREGGIEKISSFGFPIESIINSSKDKVQKELVERKRYRLGQLDSLKKDLIRKHTTGLVFLLLLSGRIAH